MRANLQKLATVMRPISDERARELMLASEAEAGQHADGYHAAESELHDEFWQRSAVIEAEQQHYVFG